MSTFMNAPSDKSSWLRDAMWQYNNMKPSALEERHEFLEKYLGTVGERVRILSPFQCDKGYNIHIGSDSYVNYGGVFLDDAEIFIGDNVRIAPNCSIYTIGHAIEYKDRAAGVITLGEVHIEDHVWIGGSVTILPGVRIGARSIIGAGSVVTKDIPADVVAYGNPCTVIREITENKQRGDESIDQL